MKLTKEKKNELIEVAQEFLVQSLNGAKILHDLVNKFIDNKLTRDELQDVIDSEHKCDRIKEKYVQILFKNKRALPFLVEDRYSILLMLDQVNDKTEFFARFLRSTPITLFDDNKTLYGELNDLTYEIIETLIDCATLIETDFDAAYKKTFDIEEIRRKARTAKFGLLEILFKKSDEPLRVYLIAKLVTYMYDVASWVEETSDYLRGLIIKYPSR